MEDLIVYFESGVPLLVGIVNGWGDCNSGEKGYARVSYFAPWILEKTGIPIVTYYSAARSSSFRRSNCGTGYIGSDVIYSVTAGAYKSTISQTAANQKAYNKISENGGAYANANGTCAILPITTPPSDWTYNIDHYSENIIWKSQYFLGDFVKIELYKIKYSYDVATGTYSVAEGGTFVKTIKESTPNNGVLINGLYGAQFTNLPTGVYLEDPFRLKITSLTTGTSYFSDFFSFLND